MRTQFSRFDRRSPLLLAALVLLYLVLSLLPAEPADALACPPGFETLPGCSGGGSGGGGGTIGTGEWSNTTIAGMNVRLYVPDTAPALAGKRALMVNLHGCAQTNDALQNGGNWPETADEYGMVVAVPNAPGGGVLIGCWDYYGTNHSRSGRHNDDLLNLVSDLLGRSELNIDPDQVYVSGLSSGGGQTMVMGCLAPDVFAGIGINAGPTVGTSSSQIGSVQTSFSSGRSTCLSFAGTRRDQFATQLTSIIYGDNDSIVAPGYNRLNAQIMADIYGAGSTSSFSLSGLEGNNTSGSGTLYADAEGPRVSLIQNSGMGHNWPAGEGPGGSYVTTNSIDYPAYVTKFFFDNNRRVDRDDDGEPPTEPGDTQPPTVNVTAPADGATVSQTVTITASAFDNVGVARVEFYVDGALIGSDSSAPYSVSWNTTTGGNGNRAIRAVAYDGNGNSAADDDTQVLVSNGATLYCGTASNAAHASAGRATGYGWGSYTSYYAKGSFGYMGMGGSKSTTLKETRDGYFTVVSSCP